MDQLYARAATSALRQQALLKSIEMKHSYSFCIRITLSYCHTSSRSGNFMNYDGYRVMLSPSNSQLLMNKWHDFKQKNTKKLYKKCIYLI